MKNILLAIASPLLLIACSTVSETQSTKMNKTPSEVTVDGWEKVNVPVVAKQRIVGKGFASSEVDYYLQRSIADYYIKFCESDVTKDEFEELYKASKDDLIVTMDLEIQMKSGDWDDCVNNNERSRKGDYVIIRLTK